MCLLLASFRFGRLAGPGALWLVAMVALACSQASKGDEALAGSGMSGGRTGAMPEGNAGTDSGDSGGAAGPSCTNDSDVRCDADGTLQICKSGQWLRAEDCQRPGRCSASRRTCLSCAPGTFACKPDGTLTQCSLDGSGWEVIRACDTSDACVAEDGVGYCRSCTAGAISCESSRRDYPSELREDRDHSRATSALRVCNATASGTERIDVCGMRGPVCDVEAARCRTCSPDEWSCDGGVLLRCNARGEELAFAKDCGHPALCDAVNGDCRAPGCRRSPAETVPPGSVSCEQSTLSVCRPDGQWDVIDICASESACSDGIEARTCLDSPDYCAPGSTVCDGLELLRCAAIPAEGASGPAGGRYFVHARCALGCTQLSASDAECDVAVGLGSAFADAMICEPGTTSFTSCGATGCQSGSCQAGTVCANNSLGCRPCVPNTYRCQDENLVRCNAQGSEESLVDSCSPGKCDAFRAACLPAKVGERYCEGSRFTTVDADGNSLLIEDCATAALCNPAYGCSSSACVLGSRSCDGATVLRCEEGTALSTTAERCESAERCEEGLGCAVAARIAAGDGHTCALVLAADAAPDATGYVKCWGANEGGQLGNGAPLLADEPEARPVLARLGGQLVAAPIFRQSGLCAGRSFSCADAMLDGRASVVCWGMGDRGQLGFGPSRSAPAEVYSANAVVQEVRAREATNNAGASAPIAGLHAVTCGADFACALDADNRPYCWGANDAGQLGIGQAATMPSAGATPVRELTTVEAIVAGGRHACAVDPANVVHCWGDNTKSQLGQAMGSAEIAAAPVAVGKLVATALALGRDFSLALTADGVRAWGQNAFGQLGTGTSMSSSEPTPSSAVQGDVALLVSGSSAAHACALGDGALACWGANPLSELGDGTVLDRYQSARVSFPEAVRLAAAPGSVALGKAHSCAIDTRGGIWCWGGNQRRQLGPRVLEDTATTPVRVY